MFAMVLLASCGGNDTSKASASNGEATPTSDSTKPLIIGAIPDQDPQLLQQRYALLCDYLSKELGVPVEFKSVNDYTAAVLAFANQDLDMVWFGSLTGVRARLQVPGAQAIVQREVDQQFHSVFIAHKSAGLQPLTELADLAQVKGKTMTFASQSSTSGRLMPQSFLEQGGVTFDDFAGTVGFAGTHDKVVDLVGAGSFEIGALSEKVWNRRVAKGTVDTATVQLIYRTPAYHNYHWVIQPRFDKAFIEKVTAALTTLNPEEHAEILDLFHAEKFIPTKNENYAAVEKTGRDIGIIK